MTPSDISVLRETKYMQSLIKHTTKSPENREKILGDRSFDPYF
jgi:hypothetical protein